VTEQPEAHLIASARDGDRVAYEALLRPLYGPAYRLAFGILHDADEAEDAVQEAAFRAWRKIGQVREGTPLRPWFLAVVANQCRSTVRARWWSQVRLADPPRDGHSPAVDHDLGIDVRTALRRLDHRQRLVLVLRYFLDLPFDEVAAVLGTSEPGARSLARRALQRVRPALRHLEEYA
jgi:RNA polymerase sigma factor (sigma-70 family)